MRQYNIKRWDVVILPNDKQNKTPIIYLEPDNKLIQFLDNHNWVVNCVISNTNKNYDNKNIICYFKNNCDIPNMRTNYFNKTGYIIGMLQTEWDGYPLYDNLGNIDFKKVRFNLKEEFGGNRKRRKKKKNKKIINKRLKALSNLQKQLELIKTNNLLLKKNNSLLQKNLTEPTTITEKVTEFFSYCGLSKKKNTSYEILHMLFLIIWIFLIIKCLCQFMKIKK
tara:strand:+ start:760 stop:1428 length:669 start_codon:yes stop_codon:yes gene_type:complete